MHDQLAGWDVRIADAQRAKGIAPLACKTDRIDAWVLAELARRDLIPEMGGHGFVDYVIVGDTVNTASRLESEAPEGGVLIGAETRRALPDGSIAEAVPGLRVKGREAAVDAYLLHALPDSG